MLVSLNNLFWAPAEAPDARVPLPREIPPNKSFLMQIKTNQGAKEHREFQKLTILSTPESFLISFVISFFLSFHIKRDNLLSQEVPRAPSNPSPPRPPRRHDPPGCAHSETHAAVSEVGFSPLVQGSGTEFSAPWFKTALASAPRAARLWLRCF